MAKHMMYNCYSFLSKKMDGMDDIKDESHLHLFLSILSIKSITSMQLFHLVTYYVSRSHSGIPSLQILPTDGCLAE